MGKITVKHYLNTKAKPNGWSTSGLVKNTYPIYVQIIHRRNVINKRSDTLIECTIEGFEYYQQTGKIKDEEFFTLFSDGYSLSTEKKIITNSIRILEDTKQPYDSSDLLNILSFFSKDIADCLIEQLEKDLFIEGSILKESGKIDNTDYYDFILSLKNKFGIYESLNNIKKYTNIDLSQFIKPEELKQFAVIQLIRSKYNNVSFAEFYYSDFISDFKKILKTETVETFDNFCSIIFELIKGYAESGGYIKISAK